MLQTLPSNSPEAEIFAALERDGGVIVKDFLSAQEVQSLNNDFAPHLESVPWGEASVDEPDEFFGLHTKRLHGLISRSPHMARVIAHPLLTSMAKHFLETGSRSRDFRISTCELMTIGGSETPQSLHRDFDTWHCAPMASPRPENLISANIALDDFTIDNGATVVVPGSHKWPHERRAGPEDMAQALMTRGSALLYSGEILHGGGRNTTDKPRSGLYVGYVSSWLRPIENQLLTNDPADILALPEATQRMLDVVPNGFSLLA